MLYKIVFPVIFVARNPRDVCVSYYHHTKTLDRAYRFGGDFDQFSDLFRQGKINFGSYWTHLKVYKDYLYVY